MIIVLNDASKLHKRAIKNISITIPRVFYYYLLLLYYSVVVTCDMCVTCFIKVEYHIITVLQYYSETILLYY